MGTQTIYFSDGTVTTIKVDKVTDKYVYATDLETNDSLQIELGSGSVISWDNPKGWEGQIVATVSLDRLVGQTRSGLSACDLF